MLDKKKAFNLAVLITPWLTVPFIRKQSFFRFLPVASFVGLFLSIFSAIANKKRWWTTKSPIFSNIPIDFPYILGPFFVGTLWVFKKTYGNFQKYLLTNIVLNFINSYPFIFIIEKVGVIKFKKMKNSTWYLFTVFMAILIYRFQYIVEKSIRKTNS